MPLLNFPTQHFFSSLLHFENGWKHTSNNDTEKKQAKLAIFVCNKDMLDVGCGRFYID